MPKEPDFVDMSETGNWNVAADFSKLKIMKWLYLADEYETIATFGTSDMLDEMMTDKGMISRNKLMAIKRLTKTLQMIISNTIFAVKKKDKGELDKKQEFLKKIEKILPSLTKKNYNQRDRKNYITIKEDEFNEVLNILVEIKTSINGPLNRADLIFTSREEFDPKKLKDKIKKDLFEIG